MLESLIGVDVGTSSVKVVAFDLNGRVLAHAERGYGIQTPQPGWVEQSPGEVWEALCSALRAVAHESGSVTRPVALALACQSGSVTLADAAGAPIYPNITWMDGRSEPLVEEWKTQDVGDRLRAACGWLLHPGLALPSLAWLARHRPDLMAGARRVLSMNDDLTHRLTGEYCTNPSNGGGMQLLDVAQASWCGEMCELACIEHLRLSTVLPSGAPIGMLTAEAAEQTGLPRDVLVVNGGHDQGCTALSMGVTTAGQVLLACGTSWVVTDVVDRPDTVGLPATMDLNFHAAPGQWTISQSLGGLGGALEWWLNQCWPALPDGPAESRLERFAALNDELGQTEPVAGGPLFAPVAGGHTSPAGLQRGGFVGLQLHHTRGDMTRAIMESAAFELRWALEDVRAAGLLVDRMSMVGGATRSPYWPRIVADVTGVPLAVSRYPHWPALGAAILAGFGAGLFDSVEAGQLTLAQPVDLIAPNADRHAAYSRQFEQYRQVG